MRTSAETHSWLKFRVSLDGVPPELWISLGECQSKCHHIAGVPIRPAMRERLMRLYLAKGALATTAIEGNTLSEDEVIRFLDGKLELPPSRQYLGQEIANVARACSEMLPEIETLQNTPITPERIKQLNAIVLNGLSLAEGVVPGEFRTANVGVARYLAPPASECPSLIARMCDWLNGSDFAARPGLEIVSSILKAILAHLYMAWIHPFGDGNGRTARMIEFQILITSGMPAPAAHLLSNHYNQTRAEYYRQLDMASKSGGDVLPFIRYAVEGFRDGLRAQVEMIRADQWETTWINFVHDQFGGLKGPTFDRRRHLVLALSQHEEPVPASDLAGLSPRLAAEYARKTPRTLSRDLNFLISMGLIDRDDHGVRALKERILAFLPPKAEQGARP